MTEVEEQGTKHARCASMSGNVPGQKVVHETAEPGKPGFLCHEITTGVENLFEGTTIATLAATPHLQVSARETECAIARACMQHMHTQAQVGADTLSAHVPLSVAQPLLWGSDGSNIIARYEVGGRRALFDGGFTRCASALTRMFATPPIISAPLTQVPVCICQSLLPLGQRGHWPVRALRDAAVCA